MSITVRIDPSGLPVEVRSQQYTPLSGTVPVGLAVIDVGDIAFVTEVTDSFRSLAAALIRAADDADKITADHADPSFTRSVNTASHYPIAGGAGGDDYESECACGAVFGAPTADLLTQMTDGHYAPTTATA